MKLNAWTKDTMRRVYVNADGLGYGEKVWFEACADGSIDYKSRSSGAPSYTLSMLTANQGDTHLVEDCLGLSAQQFHDMTFEQFFAFVEGRAK